MKVTLWQQFSSNHSASFSVVGHFPSIEEAQKSVDIFRSILTSIKNWHESDGNKWWHEYRQDYNSPDFNGRISPPEIEIAERYNVDWGYKPIDWIGHKPEELVQRVQKDVFVSTYWETWNQSTPIVNLMQIFGAKKILVQLSENIYITVYLTSELPDEKITEQCRDAISNYFIQPRGKYAPWYQSHVSTTSAHAWGKVEYIESKLMIHCQFWRIGEGLPLMISWLENMGATDIHYTLKAEAEWLP